MSLPILVTSCSHTRIVAPAAKVGDLPKGLTMQGALKEWMKILSSQTAHISPRELYRGQGFFTLVKIQDQFPLSSVKVITGGQGLIDMDEKIVPYDFTAHPKEPENIHQKVTAEPFVQTVWWRMINEARGKSPSPIAKLVSENQDRYVIIAAGKIFLRYAADDILSIPFDQRDKIRILLTASSIGSVPAQLRPMLIPYDRSFIAELPGNRNDNNHRAAQKFLELLQEPEFYNMSFTEQLQAVEGEEGVAGGVGYQTGIGKAPIDVESFLKERPHYISMPLEDAFRLTQRALGAIGGRMYFRSIVRKLKGETIKASQEEVDDAVEALRNLGDFLQSSEGIRGNSEEEEVLKGVAVFVDALKQIAPKALFQASDICRWAPAFYQKQGTPVPAMMESPNKLSFVLKNNAGILGLLPEGKGYVIVPAAFISE